MKNVYEEWDKLCQEFEAVRDAQFNAYAAVTGAFARVAKGTGGNPTKQELDDYDATSQRLEEIKRRMDEFIKANA